MLPNTHPKQSPDLADRRRSVLQEAEKCCCQDRNREHGQPEDNFLQIGRLWEAYLGSSLKKHLTAQDVAAMMILVKVARAAYNPGNLDNWVDAVGYAACGGGMVEPQQELFRDLTFNEMACGQVPADTF